MNNFSDMLSKAKAMQEKMKEAQDQIKKIEVEGQSGGNLVKVILSGDYEIKSIIISDEAKQENQEIYNKLISEYGIEYDGKYWCSNCGKELGIGEYETTETFLKSGARDVTHEEIDDEEDVDESNTMIKTLQMYIKARSDL